MTLFQDEYVGVAQGFVAGNEDCLAGLQSLLDFIVLGVLPADTDFPFDSLVPFRRHDIDPASSGMLVECPAGNHDGLFRLPELQVHIICLACADVVRLLS